MRPPPVCEYIKAQLALGAPATVIIENMLILYEEAPATIRKRRSRQNQRDLSVTETGPKRDLSGTYPVTMSQSTIEKDIPTLTSLPTTSPKKEKNPSGKKGTRLAEDWYPTKANGAWAVQQLGSRERAKAVFEKFQNYWLAKPGQGGLKLDWDRTFRTWVLTTVERDGGPEKAQPPKVTYMMV